MHAMLNIASRATREASELILDAMARPDRITVYEKGPGDYVTDVDQAVEQTLIQHIRKSYPDHSFHGEESGHTAGKDPSTIWVIDPIDGTRNFIHGLPHFCISMACIQKGKVQHGIIVDPVRGDEFTATRGSGAQMNGTRIRVSKTSEMNRALIGLAGAGHDNLDTALEIQQQLLHKVSGLRFSGSAALDLAYVAAGRLDGGWMAGMSHWDYAAGGLMVQEAGGLISQGNGNPDLNDARSLVFGSPRIFKHLLKVTGARASH